MIDDIPEGLRRDANNKAPFMDAFVTVLKAEAFDAFLKVLDNPPKPSAALVRLMKHEPPWASRAASLPPTAPGWVPPWASKS